MKLRNYLKMDYNDILEISSYIWDGQDYVPDVINNFLANRNCYPVVVEVDSKVVSVANTHKFSETYYWLHAMRTHPKYRGRGYATELTKYQEALVKELGGHETWLITSLENKATAKMLKRLQYEEICQYKLWKNTQPTDISKIPRDTKPDEEEWSVIKSVTLLNQAMNNLEDSIPHLLIGEFMTYPGDSYFIETMLTNGEIYSNSKSNALMTISKSAENQRDYIIGITTSHKDIMESASRFALETITQYLGADNEVLIFYPAIVESVHFASDRYFRLLRKQL